MTFDGANGSDHGSLGWFAKRTLVVLAIVVLAVLVWRIINALLLAFVGILLAMVFRGLAGLISRHTPVPIGSAMVMVAVILIALIALFIWLAGPPINDQLSQLVKTLPGSIKQVEEVLSRYVVGRYILDYIKAAPAAPGGPALVSGVTGLASTLYEIIADIILVIVSAIYFSANPELYRRGILLLVPRARIPRMAEVLDQTARTLQYWLLGQLFLMISVGILVTIGLWVVDVPLALVLGIITAMFEFVPVVGTIISAVPGILIGLSGGWMRGLDAFLVYFIVQEIEANVFTPLVQRTTVSLPPALVVLAVVAFGYVFGIIGVFIATPLTAVALVWIKLLYVEDVLGKSTHTS
jgi:predicted PurR-regulated permease PerM